MEQVWLLLGCLLALSVGALSIWRNCLIRRKFGKHLLLSEPRYHRLPQASATRQRLTKAAELWQAAWTTLENARDVETAKRAVLVFGQALEIDEFVCGWKNGSQQKLVMMGELFSLPSGLEADRFHACLAEAYVVLLLNAVMEVYGKPVDAEVLASDYRMVKSRLDESVERQPDNPVAYKLRASWCQHFGGLADSSAIQADFQTAIRLAEQDVEGAHLALHGLDVHAQRSHVLAYCHFQLATLLQQGKDFAAAAVHYRAALEQADADSIQLADLHFNLAIITILTAGPAREEQAAALGDAARHYKAGLAAAKRRRRWCMVGNDVSQELAAALLARVSSMIEVAPKKPLSQKKDD